MKDIVTAMRVLVQVVDSGSFARAAAVLGMSSSVVTRQVAGLEGHLGARLLHRTTRRLSLTDAGAEFCARARDLLEQIAEVEAVASAHSRQPSGLLRISAPLTFGISQLAPLLPEFLQRYPGLRLDLDLSDRMVDLANEAIDIALRIVGGPLDAGLIARHVAEIDMLACAAPAYLREHDPIRHPNDLAHHATLGFSYLWAGDDWTFVGSSGEQTRVRVQPRVHATNGDMLRELAVAGTGIIFQPTFVVSEQLRTGALVQILEDYRAPTVNLYAVYLSRRHVPGRVRAFLEYLLERLPERLSSPRTRE